MNRVVTFLKSSAVYFVGNILTKLITFLLLPLYTGYIVKADMGYYDLSVSYISAIVPIVCMEIWSGIMRFMFDFEKIEDKYKAVFNGFVIFGSSVLIYTVGTALLGSFLNIRCLILIFFYGLLTMLQQIYTYIVRGLQKSVIFAISGIIGSLTTSVSNIIMILVLNMRLESMYIALILGLSVQIVFMEFSLKLLPHLSFKMFDRDMIKRMVKFAFPLCLNSACFWLLSSYNRVGISNTLGLEANGIYSVAGKFTFALSLVAQCFTMAWQEMIYGLKEGKAEKAEFYTTASNLYLKFLMYGMVLLVPFISLIFPFLVAESYSEAYIVVPLYLIGTAASIYSMFLGNIFSAEKKTNIVLYSTMAAAAVNVALFHILVQFIGIQAANISLFCGYMVNIIMRIRLLGKDMRIRINFKLMLFTAALFAAAVWIYLKLPWWGNLLSLFGFGCVTLIAFRDMIKTMLGTLSKTLKKS